MIRRGAGLCALLGFLGGCGGGGGARPAPAAPPPPVRPPVNRAVAPDDWHGIATEADRRRLRDWRPTWTTALKRAGADPRIAAAGALLEPDAALEGVALPAGTYRCRVTKLGARTPGLANYAAYPAFTCRVARGANGLMTLTKIDGSQRPAGTLYPDGTRRMVFLGTMVLGDEQRAQPYGRDPERDMAGFVERIGPARWRLALPAPRWESLFDVFELVPA